MVDGAVKATVLTDTYDILVDILGDYVTDPLSRTSDSDWIKRGTPNPNDYIGCKAGGTGWQRGELCIDSVVRSGASATLAVGNSPMTLKSTGRAAHGSGLETVSSSSNVTR